MSDKQGVFAAVKRYGAELVIVFVGVYAAFWVEDWRDQRERDARTDQVISTLRQDLDDQARTGQKFVDGIDARLAEWEAKRARGERPAPYVLRINRSEIAPMAAWDAVSRSDIVELLDPSLVFDLGYFYSESNGVGRKYVRYAEFTDAYVMPGLKRGNDWFYAEDSVELKPEFAAHMDRLRDYQAEMRELVAWARCLYDRLEPGADKTEACRPAESWKP